MGPVASQLSDVDLRHLLVHAVVAARLLVLPEQVVAFARSQLAMFERVGVVAAETLADWEGLLSLPPGELASALVDPGPFYCRLREVSPFANLLSPHARAAVWSRFCRQVS